jgi:DNA-binding NtrC family response regulator
MPDSRSEQSIVSGLPMTRATVRALLVEDEDAMARVIARRLAAHDVALTHLSTADQIETLLATAGRDDIHDVILLDVNLPGHTGLEILQCLRARGSDTAVIMLTGDASAATATAAMRAGAYHYLVKADLDDRFIEVIRSASAHTALSRQLRAPKCGEGTDLETEIVGKSVATAELRHQIRQVAGSAVNVLVTGESGTGKEVAARAIHRLSTRGARPFVPVNCGSIPEGLIDSELFGHVRGSFTGATANRAGVFVEADGGTLFLDEIGDMPLAVQARLLRAIQHGEVRPVGGDVARTIDVRVVAATNVDLAKAVAAGQFRADLLFRLNVVNVIVKPLRERRDDLPALIAVLLRKHVPAPAEVPQVSAAALEAMYAYPWPGNVRELENALLHALAMKTTDLVEPGDLPPAIGGRLRLAGGSGVLSRVGDGTPLTEAKRTAALEFERNYLLQLMDRAQGSVSSAARMAGVDRTNFRRLLQRHGIDSSRFKH